MQRFGSGLRYAALLAGTLVSACTSTGNVAELESALAAQDSATAALGDWCAAHRIADPPTIVARRISGEMAPPADIAARLGEGTLGYRHVELACGGAVLSVAHNWYVKDRLTPAMNAALDTTDIPFGKVAAPLAFTRERLGSTRGAAPGCPPGTVLSHRALLRLPDGRPLSFVVECYQPALMGR